MNFLSKIAVLTGLACLSKITFMGELDLLIHPRYFWLIYLSIVIIFLILVFVSPVKSKKMQFPYLILTLCFIWGIVIDLNPLSSNAQQQVSNYISTKNNDLRSQYITNFNIDTGNMDLEELLKVLSVNPEPKNYEGKEVKVSGFYFEDRRGEPMIAKYVLSCCAADARIAGVWLNENLNLDPDTWIEINGVLTEKELEGVRFVSIAPEKITIIEIPDTPYATN